MDFLELARSRFSVRKYKNRPVEEEKLLKVLEAGRLAPSAVNFQPWHFIVIRGKSNLEKIYSVYDRAWIREAPVVIAICADHSQSWKRKQDGKDHADIDIAIAADHMTLMAADLGLGTCWVCNFDVDKCTDVLGLPPGVEPAVLLPLGYPDIDRPEKKRKPLVEVTHSEKYGNRFS